MVVLVVDVGGLKTGTLTAGVLVVSQTRKVSLSKMETFNPELIP